jgi:F420H(2)-dependent quinone reductase
MPGGSPVGVRLYQEVARRATLALTRAHLLVHRVSGGRCGWSFGRVPMILLRTTGARSGLPRTVPLQVVRDAGAYVVTGSNSGLHHDPGWVANLRADPSATVLVRGRELPVRAEEVTDPAERERLYSALTAQFPAYAGYRRRAGRIIPVFRLHPLGPAPAAG